MLRCPTEITPNINTIIELCLLYLKYDPNYNTDVGDDDEEMDEDEEMATEDEEDDDEDEGCVCFRYMSYNNTFNQLD